MQLRIVRIGFFLVLITAAALCAAQSTTPGEPPTSPSPQAPANQAPRIQNPGNPNQPKPPDMVCFGYGPKWSIQFINGEARYLGINQPDQDFLGDFYYVPQDKVWEWHRANGLAPMNGGYALSATIQKNACADPVRKETYPYSAQVNLPTGDMVSGCCRKLKAGEAPVGKHGLESAPPTNAPQSTTSQPATSPQAKPQPQ